MAIFLCTGGAAGAVAATTMARDFEGVGTILLNLDDDKKEKLFVKACKIFESLSVEDYAELHRLITNPDAKKELLNIVVNYVENELKMNIVD